MNGISTIHKYTLQQLFQDVKISLTLFSHITLNHVYRNKNEEVDWLSQDRLVLDRGTWKVTEKTSTGASKFLHKTWLHI
jgi:hypothetical protein